MSGINLAAAVGGQQPQGNPWAQLMQMYMMSQQLGGGMGARMGANPGNPWGTPSTMFGPMNNQSGPAFGGAGIGSMINGPQTNPNSGFVNPWASMWGGSQGFDWSNPNPGIGSMSAGNNQPSPLNPPLSPSTFMGRPITQVPNPSAVMATPSFAGPSGPSSTTMPQFQGNALAMYGGQSM